MFGLSFGAFFWLFGIRALALIVGIVIAIIGKNEGDKVEEDLKEYDITNWYHTF